MQSKGPLAGRPSIVPSELKAIIHKKKQPEEKGFRHLITTFFKERYSGHGLRKILTDDSLPRRAIWLIIFLICFALALSHVAGIVVEYYHRPIITNLKIAKAGRVVFPSVTICHQDPFDFKGNTEEEPDPVPNWMTTYDIMAKTFEALSFPDIVCPSKAQFAGLADLVPSGLDDVTKLQDWLTVTEDRIQTLSYDYKEVIHDCSFNGMACDETKFHETLHYKYGRCYTFNSNFSVSNDEPFDTLKYGMANGLKLVLKQSLEGSQRRISHPNGGFRISVHSPDVHPNPEEDGYDVALGEEVTDIGVKSKDFKRLDTLSKPCTQADPYLKGFDDHAACRTMCYDKIIREKCECTRLMGVFAPENKELCDTTNPDHSSCLRREMKKLQDSSLCPECNAPCMERVYEISAISSKRNQDIKVLELARRIRNRETCDDKELDFEEYTLVDVNVYLENIIQQTHEEVFRQTLSEILLHIGAMLSLFLGFSLVIILEFIELLIDFIILCCRRGKQVDPDDDVESEEVMIRYHGFPFAFSNMVAGQAKRTSQSSVMSDNILQNIEVMSGKETKDPWGYY